MPTLEELFKTKKLISGKTAEQQYDIRNSKSTPISSAAGLMTIPMQSVNKIRQNNSNITNETFLEEELTGVRVLSKLSSPILYGTKIARFTLQQSDDVEEMKGANNPNGGNGGLLGGLVNAGRSAINSVKSFLGIPQNITPTKLYLNTTQFNGTTIGSHLTMRQLAKIKKDGAGSLVGKFLSQNASGTPGQMANSLPGAAAEAGKKALKNILLGSGNEGAINLAKMQTGVNNIYSMGIPLDDFYLFTSYPLQSSSVRQYKYSRTKKIRGDIDERNDLSSRYNEIKDDGRLPEKTYSLSRYASYAYTSDREFYKKSLTTKRGLTNNFTDDNGNAQVVGNYKDKLNEYSAYLGETKKIDGTETTLDDLDLIPLKFYSIAKNASVNFRATVTGLTETFTPTWDSSKMIGNPFQFWTYSQIDRTLQFNFKVYSLSAKEHIAAWQRLSFLTSLVYPQTYGNTANDPSAIENYVVPPFLKFTLGDMYKGKECFIQSLIYTIDDNNTWDIGAGALTLPEKPQDTGAIMNDKITKDYKLPNVIDVGITLQFVETKASTYRNRMYGFGGTKTNVQTAEEKALQLYPDGTPIDSAKIAAAKSAADEEKRKNAEAVKRNKDKEASEKKVSDSLLRKDPNYNPGRNQSMNPKLYQNGVLKLNGFNTFVPSYLKADWKK